MCDCKQALVILLNNNCGSLWLLSYKYSLTSTCLPPMISWLEAELSPLLVTWYRLNTEGSQCPMASSLILDWSHFHMESQKGSWPDGHKGWKESRWEEINDWEFYLGWYVEQRVWIMSFDVKVLEKQEGSIAEFMYKAGFGLNKKLQDCSFCWILSHFPQNWCMHCTK